MGKILISGLESRGPSRTPVWGREVIQNHPLGRNCILKVKNPIGYNSSSTTTVTTAFTLFESSLQGWIYLKHNLVAMTQGRKHNYICTAYKY